MTLAERSAGAPRLAEDSGASRRVRSMTWLPAVGSVLVGTALIAGQAARYGYWIVDDAAISFAYARNIADGFGPVLQPGAAPVEGYSNPAWVGLLALGKLLGLFDRGTIVGIPDYVLFPKALALACCVGILIAGYWAAKKVTRHPWVVPLVTGAILATIPSFIVWSFSGLENSLYALAAVWLAVVIFRASVDGRLLSPWVAAGAGALAALAALTRPDGLIYAAAYPIVVLIHLRVPRLWTSARAILISVLGFAVPFGGYVLWRILEFGHLTAMPAIAKRQSAPTLADFTRISEIVNHAGAPAVLVLVAVVALALAGPSRLRDGLIALIVPLALGLIAYAVLELDWMEQLRFATPVWALGAIIVSLAVYRVFSRAATRTRALLGIVLIAAVAPSVAAFQKMTDTFRANPTVSVCLIADRFGRTFNGYADILRIGRGTLLEPDIGGPSLTSRLTLVDLAGLAEARIAAYWSAADAPGLRNYVFDEARPTFIHGHPPWTTWTGVTDDPRIQRDYHQIYSDANGWSDWVRKDAVTDQARLAEVRTYAATAAPRVWAAGLAAPRAHCGPRLEPGQLPG